MGAVTFLKDEKDLFFITHLKGEGKYKMLHTLQKSSQVTSLDKLPSITGLALPCTRKPQSLGHTRRAQSRLCDNCRGHTQGSGGSQEHICHTAAL